MQILLKKAMNHKPGSVTKSFAFDVYCHLSVRTVADSFQQSTRVYPAGRRQAGIPAVNAV